RWRAGSRQCTPHHPTARGPQQGRRATPPPFVRGCVHDGTQVVHSCLERRHLADAIGKTGPAAVELDHAGEGGETVEERDTERLLRGCLEVPDEAVDEDEVDLPSR